MVHAEGSSPVSPTSWLWALTCGNAVRALLLGSGRQDEAEGDAALGRRQRGIPPAVRGDDARVQRAFADAFSVFAGPSFTQMISFSRSDVTALAPWGLAPSQSVRLIPGFVIGAQLF